MSKVRINTLKDSILFGKISEFLEFVEELMQFGLDSIFDVDQLYRFNDDEKEKITYFNRSFLLYIEDEMFAERADITFNDDDEIVCLHRDTLFILTDTSIRFMDGKDIQIETI